jgi:hypothetical protein
VGDTDRERYRETMYLVGKDTIARSWEKGDAGKGKRLELL